MLSVGPQKDQQGTLILHSVTLGYTWHLCARGVDWRLSGSPRHLRLGRGVGGVGEWNGVRLLGRDGAGALRSSRMDATKHFNGHSRDRAQGGPRCDRLASCVCIVFSRAVLAEIHFSHGHCQLIGGHALSVSVTELILLRNMFQKCLLKRQHDGLLTFLWQQTAKGFRQDPLMQG